uniref:sensor histidine kinase n=1 Tax=uncultured Winogradskyella sp. TaxID=395353 RepID=UPI0030DC41F6
MAMHNSEELLEVITVVSEQLQELDFKFVHVSFANNDNSEGYKFWTAAKGLSRPMRFTTPYLDIAVFNNLRAAQEKSDSFCTDVITKKEHNKWHSHLLKHGGSKVFSKEDNAFIMSRGMARSIAINPNIMLILANYASIPYSEDENKIIERFGQVFEQSYTRFLDLQKAEQQTREAQIETALEKVRSRTMAMQHSDELPEAANNLFLQVQELGIPAWSAGYCIWEDESKTSASCNMSSEGEIQKAFSLPTIGEGYNFYDPYKKGEIFHVSECGGKNLVKHYEFMKTLPTVGVILEELEKAGISLPTFQIFHIVFLKFGYVMFITYETVPDAHHIFKRFGQVFEQTYTRFLDLKLKEDQAVKLEAEKQRLEKTLSDLQQTQKQLIQSEKMASLGELTAGIAHEIQNPLNFVNNFSEVSKELLEEMLEEIEAGDMEEVRAIMSDIVQNLDKINHHGKRADGIVKGMLQHSRASGNKKEPTNINALADEYLRLAYHGLRAKDKSFNAHLETDYDNDIKTVDVIPQDIGRVILNLFTNAFYAVNEKKQLNIDGYEPNVTLSTKKNGNQVTISVKDNGNGIPKKALDKIFQPFFTTKPTGQGTGLGLSMSYDIITKGHGGELKVDTKQDKGTEFNIILPIK